MGNGLVMKTLQHFHILKKKRNINQARKSPTPKLNSKTKRGHTSMHKTKYPPTMTFPLPVVYPEIVVVPILGPI